jgi:outer membrane protein TolC
VQSDQAVSLNLVQLYKALGGGWEKNAETATTSVEARSQ